MWPEMSDTAGGIYGGGLMMFCMWDLLIMAVKFKCITKRAAFVSANVIYSLDWLIAVLWCSLSVLLKHGDLPHETSSAWWQTLQLFMWNEKNTSNQEKQ